jgi:hypothetical protein
VEQIDRAEAARLVQRWRDERDGRVTRVKLTPDAEARLTRLAYAHLDELKNLAPVLDQVVSRWSRRSEPTGHWRGTYSRHGVQAPGCDCATGRQRRLPARPEPAGCHHHQP